MMTPDPRVLRHCALHGTLFLLTALLAEEPGTLPPFQFGEKGLWRAHGPLGGLVQEEQAAGTAWLRTERVPLDDGESWEGCVTLRGNNEVLPGQRYRLAVEARGDGVLTLGLFEYPWKYSEKALASPGKQHRLTPQFQELTFDYSVDNDRVSHVRPYLRLSGWHACAELRTSSFRLVRSEGTVALRLKDFVAPLGTKLEVEIQSSHWPVKLLLYGPDGECGPPGPLGGSSGWTDHYRRSWMIAQGAQERTSAQADLQGLTVEGTYRFVGIAPATGQSAMARLALMPPDAASEMQRLVGKVQLPEGSRLVFAGDSLTALFPDRNYVALLDRALRWRLGDRVEVFNAGQGGSNIRSLEQRLGADVLGRRPTHVFLFEGANDCKRYYDPPQGALRGWTVPPDAYAETLRRVIQRIRDEAHARVVLLTCAPGDTTLTGRFHDQARALGLGQSFFCLPAEVEQLVGIQKAAAKDLGLDLIDMHARLTEYMAAREQSGSRQYAHVDDGIHLSEYGHREVARAILKYLAQGK